MGSTGVTVVLQCGQLWESSRSLQTCRLPRDSPRSERVCGSRHAVAERPEPCGVRCETAEATRAQLGPLRGAVLSPAAHRHGQLVQRQVPRRSHKVPAVRHAGGCLEGGAQLSHATACLTAARYDFSGTSMAAFPPCVFSPHVTCLCGMCVCIVRAKQTKLQKAHLQQAGRRLKQPLRSAWSSSTTPLRHQPQRLLLQHCPARCTHASL